MPPVQRNDRSHSSIRGLGFFRKLRENLQLLWIRLSGTEGPERFDGLFNEFAEYGAELKRHSGRDIRQCRVFEIGYGARPNRLIALSSLGVDAHGIDFDRPSLGFSPANLLSVMRRNGLERALKSAVRSLVFDRSEWRHLGQAIAQRGGKLRVDPARFLVGDATQLELAKGSLDLVYSEDVFEHIPAEALPKLLQRMHQWLKPDGLALIRPNIYTGIMGSHLTEWYLHHPDREMARPSEPWEHLRQNRFHANCYLNKLWRRDYRRLFSAHFEIVEERVELPDLGRRHYQPALQVELARYPEEELFSNRVLFILKPKLASGH